MISPFQSEISDVPVGCDSSGPSYLFKFHNTSIADVFQIFSPLISPSHIITNYIPLTKHKKSLLHKESGKQNYIRMSVLLTKLDEERNEFFLKIVLNNAKQNFLHNLKNASQRNKMNDKPK